MNLKWSFLFRFCLEILEIVNANTKTHFRIKFQVTNFSQVLIQKSRPSGSRLPHYHQIKSNTTKPINQVSTHYRKIF